MLWAGKRAALGRFSWYFRVFLIRMDDVVSSNLLIISNLFVLCQLLKCLAYLRQKKSWCKINERFVRKFHSERKPIPCAVVGQFLGREPYYYVCNGSRPGVYKHENKTLVDGNRLLLRLMSHCETIRISANSAYILCTIHRKRLSLRPIFAG